MDCYIQHTFKKSLHERIKGELLEEMKNNKTQIKKNEAIITNYLEYKIASKNRIGLISQIQTFAERFEEPQIRMRKKPTEYGGSEEQIIKNILFKLKKDFQIIYHTLSNSSIFRLSTIEYAFFI